MVARVGGIDSEETTFSVVENSHLRHKLPVKLAAKLPIAIICFRDVASGYFASAEERAVSRNWRSA